MKWNCLTAIVVAGTLVIGHAERASADAFVGGLIGGIIGGAIGSSQGQRVRPRSPQPASAATLSQRQQNREVQTALNHFGFNVGTPDGSIGPRSRAGISQYQSYLDFPATGQLTEFERSVLITAYQRAQFGGPQVMRIVNTHRDGQRGLLSAVRDELAGGRTRSAGAYGLPAEVADAVDEIAAASDPSAEQLVQRSGFIQLADLNGDGRTDYILDTSVTGSAFWCNAQACTVQVFVSTPDGYARNDFQAFDVTPAMFSCHRGDCSISRESGDPVAVSQPATQAQGAMAAPVASAQPMVPNPGAAPAVPNFFAAQGGTQVSLASHCNRVALVTSANGGYSDLNTMSDPMFALNEQFCLARTFAITDGEALAAQVPGATPQTIAGQCEGFAPLLQPHVTALSMQPRDEVIREVAGFVLRSGMSPADLSATARICLSSGYMSDNLVVAVGSALLLVALGETAYGELPAHHLVQGVGAQQRRDLALDWYRTSVPTSVTSASIGFAPEPVSRNALIHAAVNAIYGADTTTQGSVVPVFTLRSGN